MDGSAHAPRRSRSAGKYTAETPAPPAVLDKEKSKPRRSSSSGKLKVSRDLAKAAFQGGGASRRKSAREEPVPPPVIEVVRNESKGGLGLKGHNSQGEMALNDVSEESPAPNKKPGLFRRLSRNNSIRNIEKRKMKHPRELDICYGSANHPGTIALTEAVVNAMNKFTGKGWGPPIYKAIRNDLQGRRFFIRDGRDSPWREASPEERVECTKQLFELKRKERRR